jgi:hypothetical protein
MYLRELSNAEAPEDGLLDTVSLVALTRNTAGWSAKSANCIRVGVGAIYRIARFWRGVLCGVRKF